MGWSEGQGAGHAGQAGGETGGGKKRSEGMWGIRARWGEQGAVGQEGVNRWQRAGWEEMGGEAAGARLRPEQVNGSLPAQ